MYLRIITVQAQPGQVEELARRWKEYFGGIIRQGRARPRVGYITGDREASTVLAATMWETQPDEAVVGPIMRDFAEQVRDITAGPPTINNYEVLAEL